MASFAHLRRRSTYLRRHARTLLPHVTARKLANALLCEAELRLRRTRPRSAPPFVKIEATPLCQLRCPTCLQADPAFRASLDAEMQLTVERLAAIVEPLVPTLLGVSLSYSGEPMLNRRIAEIARYLHERNVAVTFPTNLSVHLRPEEVDALVLSGVDTLMVSLDGASDETYRQYRKGGSFARVVANVAALAEAKRRLGRTRPTLVWKFVVFDHNRHEVDAVERTYRGLGFDAFELVANHDDDDAGLRAARAATFAGKGACFWPWSTMVIRWDGAVQPCCESTGIRLGDASAGGARATWRGDAYAALRRGFHRADYGERMHPECVVCLTRGGDAAEG